MNALIAVDLQRDFAEGGSLAVQGGTRVAAKIHDFIVKHQDEYVLIVATKCWHPNRMDFEHFSETPDFDKTWPMHCVAFSEGANFIPELEAYDPKKYDQWDGHYIDFDQIFYKGQFAPAYSGFEGRRDGGRVENTLKAYLDDRRIKHVDVVGIATDYCVKATALDAQKIGYDTSVLLDMCAGVSQGTTNDAIEEMSKAGVHVDGAVA